MSKAFWAEFDKLLYKGRPPLDPSIPLGDGVALTVMSGPHFAPSNPPIGTVHYCAISEQTYVYAEPIGHAGWKMCTNVDAHPEMVETENKRIREGLGKLARTEPESKS